MHKQRLQKLMQIEYMSSESSGEESDEENVGGIKRSVIVVKKIVWLRKKYRDAFHQIDSAYYNKHKRSRDKLKKHVYRGESSRSQPDNDLKFAVKSEFRNSEEPLACTHDDSASTLDTSTDNDQC